MWTKSYNHLSVNNLSDFFKHAVRFLTVQNQKLHRFADHVVGHCHQIVGHCEHLGYVGRQPNKSKQSFFTASKMYPSSSIWVPKIYECTVVFECLTRCCFGGWPTQQKIHRFCDKPAGSCSLDKTHSFSVNCYPTIAFTVSFILFNLTFI